MSFTFPFSFLMFHVKHFFLNEILVCQNWFDRLFRWRQTLDAKSVSLNRSTGFRRHKLGDGFSRNHHPQSLPLLRLCLRRDERLWGYHTTFVMTTYPPCRIHSPRCVATGGATGRFKLDRLLEPIRITIRSRLTFLRFAQGQFWM